MHIYPDIKIKKAIEGNTSAAFAQKIAPENLRIQFPLYGRKNPMHYY
jgi:hypothetical protein